MNSIVLSALLACASAQFVAPGFGYSGYAGYGGLGGYGGWGYGLHGWGSWGYPGWGYGNWAAPSLVASPITTTVPAAPLVAAAAPVVTSSVAAAPLVAPVAVPSVVRPTIIAPQPKETKISVIQRA
ncbi:hypothetical protein PFISCL1PPCAC_17101 [Pristionchus fissidentatus]|uniref:Cuticle protein n=1 Tax=Pristionchus fissidentatus TaxID=1538716 RepID=A0AAV5W1M5_9BILA|nr:hypothetical protein PFISCL1PPCAC_17101 [Pristionchus fissidentatus]